MASSRVGTSKARMSWQVRSSDMIFESYLLAELWQLAKAKICSLCTGRDGYLGVGF